MIAAYGLWIPAFAGMTVGDAGMTVRDLKGVYEGELLFTDELMSFEL